LMAKEITGIEPITHGRYGRHSDNRSFTPHLCGHIDDYCHDALGIPSVTVELGNGFNSLGMNSYDVFDGELYGRELIAKVAAMHEAKGGKIAEPWVAIKHPQLGDVEVGGQFHYNAYFMDPDDMLDLIPNVATYCLKVAELAPVLTLTKTACEAVGEGVYRIRANVMNESTMGTKAFEAASSYHTGIATVQFGISGAQEILNQNTNPSVASLYPMESAAAEWFVRAKSGDVLTVKVTHPKAVDAVAEIIVP